ncbi:MAG: hypothetical protein LBV22_02055 [Mycoplasmataceae bacterium]|jgi:hypothetical protein|nr:hypothetical protein [Mycoplasmataceae bacterium]
MVRKKLNKQEREAIEQEKTKSQNYALTFYIHFYLRILAIPVLPAVIIFNGLMINNSKTLFIILLSLSSLLVVLTTIGLCIQIHTMLKITKHKKLNSKKKNKKYYNKLCGFYSSDDKSILGLFLPT